MEDMHRALHWAAEKCQLSIVELILQRPGVDVNVKLQGDTALFVACKSSHLQTIEVLIRGGADPNIFCESINEGKSRRSSRASLPKQKSSSACERGYTALHALCKRKVRGKEASSLAAQSVKVLLQAVSQYLDAQGIFKRPRSIPGAEDQLIDKVRMIYNRLIIVEKVYIEVDKLHSESKAPLSGTQWQEIISLHRRLLNKHHDFLLAS